MSTYSYTSMESMSITYSMGKSLAERIVDQLDKELEKESVSGRRLNDLFQALRNCLAVTGSKASEDERNEATEEEKG